MEELSIEQLKEVARGSNLGFAGSVSPEQAYHLQQKNMAVLVDIRTPEEIKFVGYPHNSIFMPFSTGTSFQSNPRFVKEVEKKFKKEEIILLICRSGNRSKKAAEALTKAGYLYVFNVLEGFEGDLNEAYQRNQLNGWKVKKLPWRQD